MRLTLSVPGLLLPRAVLADTVFDLAAPALELLLGRARRDVLAPGWLAARFGLDRLPVAALRKVGRGGTASGEHLCLDPVHLKVERSGITLVDPSHLALTLAEASELIAALQPLLADWGELSASIPGHWELQLSRSPQLETRPLPEAIGQPADPALPGGLDGRAWRRLLSELQTVLHAHPVNRRREETGQPLVNSLWPWGQGTLPERTPAAFDAVWSDEPLHCGLAVHAGMRSQPAPASFAPAAGSVLAHIDRLARPALALDALAWREALQELERDWLQPALAALRRGECTELTLVAGAAGHAAPPLSFSLTRAMLYRFWRRPQPLTSLSELA
jgi:hypothetical protein